MQANGETPGRSDDSPGKARASWREILIAFAVSALLTAIIIALGGSIPLLAENGLVLVAIVFLAVPTVMLRRRQLEPADYGLTLSGWRPGLKWSLVLVAITLAPFWLGFHIWEAGFLGHHLELEADNYRAWPESLRVRPQTDTEGAYLWRFQRNLVVHWSGSGDWAIDVATDGLLEHRSGVLPLELRVADAAGPSGSWSVRSARDDAEVVFWARHADWLEITIHRDGQPLAPGDIQLGGEGAESNPIRLGRSLWWIPQALLLQLLLVALPEEFFYRGYIQGRLNELSPRKYRLGPFHTSVPIVVTSALFALGHFVVGFDPQRLAVFFPSLAFGWLRDRTNGLVAPLVYHAACNLMVELTVVHYWPS